jgi:methionyl-tRNA formyltransferase
MSAALRVAFAGTPEFALPPLQALAESRHSIVGVLTQPDRPAGRGRQLSASPVKALAVANKWPLAQPATLRSTEGRATFAHWQPDVLVVVAYGLILPPEALSIPRYGCINVHASLLPRWRGAAPIQRAILAGDRDSGVSIMQMDAGLDTGPVFATETYPIGATTTSAELAAALAERGARLLLAVLEQIAAGRAQPQPQPSEGVSYAHKLTRADGVIDFANDAEFIARQVRALADWPGAVTSCGAANSDAAGTVRDAESLRLHGAVALPDSACPAASAARARGAASGIVLGLAAVPAGVAHAGELAVQVLCGQGVLAICQLQRAGRRVVSAREFSNAVALDHLRLGAT